MRCCIYPLVIVRIKYKYAKPRHELSLCKHALLSDPGSILSARHSAFRTAAFRPFNNVGFLSSVSEVIIMTTTIHISGLNNTACILAAPGSIPPLTGTHAGLLPTRRLGFGQEGLEASPPLTFWITTTHFIRLTADSQCLGFTSAR